MECQTSPDRTIAEDIRRHLADTLMLGPAVGPSTPLFESGLIDSTGFVMIVSYLETRFGIAVEGDDLVPENFGTIESIARLVESKRAA